MSSVNDPQQEAAIEGKQSEAAPDSTQVAPSGRIPIIDQKFISKHIISTNYQNRLFQRVVAKGILFERVNFSFSLFDTCYLRNCRFSECNFTGCRFLASNLHGSSFRECTFDYVVFERTIVDSEIFDSCSPRSENLKLRFARTLRTNFQTQGDVASINKAIHVELEATQEHLWKSWISPEEYYRNKYRGWIRVKMFFEWSSFKLLDAIWGNGESVMKLGISVCVLLGIMAFIDYESPSRPWLAMSSGTHIVSQFLMSLRRVPAIFFGAKSPSNYNDLYLAAIVFIRLISVSFLMSIVIKRYSRR